VTKPNDTMMSKVRTAKLLRDELRAQIVPKVHSDGVKFHDWEG
jgi:hypothetical protein